MARCAVPAALLLSLSLAPAAAVDRLTIVNSCKRAPIWIAHLANVGVGPGQQNVKIEPGGSYAFSSEDTDGLGGARYWPKMGCDEKGDDCAMGGSGGPSQMCSDKTPDYSSCAPPIDTKFEATWGLEGQPCDPADPAAMQGCDFVDISLVDGWTLPFLLEVTSGRCTTTGDEVMERIDCSQLSVNNCPKDDDLGHGKVDMTAISPQSNEPVGCYGPCLKLIDDKWGNNLATGRQREDDDVVPYCCTTPPEDSEKCNAGPIVNTKYVNAVHNFCPGVYSFAYDDGMGLIRCHYATYKLTFFCPEGSGEAPAPVQQAPVTSAASHAAPPAQQQAPVEPGLGAAQVAAAGFAQAPAGTGFGAPAIGGQAAAAPAAPAAQVAAAGFAQAAAPAGAAPVSQTAPAVGGGFVAAAAAAAAPMAADYGAGVPGAVAAQAAPPAALQSCQQLGCGSHLSGNCACNDECDQWNDCCEDYATMCLVGAPPAVAAIQRSEVITDAGWPQAQARLVQPALLAAAVAGLATTALVAAAAWKAERREQLSSMRTASVQPVE